MCSYLVNKLHELSLCILPYSQHFSIAALVLSLSLSLIIRNIEIKTLSVLEYIIYALCLIVLCSPKTIFYDNNNAKEHENIKIYMHIKVNPCVCMNE